MTTPTLPTADVQAAVNAWYDVATAVLGEQRKLATTLVEAGAAAAGTWTEQARTYAAAFPFPGASA